MPIRIQRKRTNGWKMPENTVYVGRPTVFCNDWTMEDARLRRIEDPKAQREWVVRAYAADLRSWMLHGFRAEVEKLRGKDLACWCPLDQPCHADVLLKIANS